MRNDLKRLQDLRERVEDMFDTAEMHMSEWDQEAFFDVMDQITLLIHNVKHRGVDGVDAK